MTTFYGLYFSHLYTYYKLQSFTCLTSVGIFHVLHLHLSFWLVGTLRTCTSVPMCLSVQFKLIYLVSLFQTHVVFIINERGESKYHSFFSNVLKVFSWFQTEIHCKCLNIRKKGWKQLKKVLWQAFSCAQLPRAGQNTQQCSSNINFLNISFIITMK